MRSEGHTLTQTGMFVPRPSGFTNICLCFRENLSKDLYLMSQMDSDQFVPIWTIASMEGIKVLTTDMDLILDVLRCKKKTWILTFNDLHQCMRVSGFNQLLMPFSLTDGPSGRKGGESSSQSQTVHYHPEGGPRDHACGGKAGLYTHP